MIAVVLTLLAVTAAQGIALIVVIRRVDVLEDLLRLIKASHKVTISIGSETPEHFARRLRNEIRRQKSGWF